MGTTADWYVVKSLDEDIVELTQEELGRTLSICSLGQGLGLSSSTAQALFQRAADRSRSDSGIPGNVVDERTAARNICSRPLGD
jgi:hypothetical protein